MRWLRRARRPEPAPLRLPQDVLVSGVRPDHLSATASVAELATMHRQAGGHDDRARALWGLVAHGDAAVGWCASALESNDLDTVADAAGVLGWIGVPSQLVPRITVRLEELPHGEASDALLALLTPEDRSRVLDGDAQVQLGSGPRVAVGLPAPHGGPVLNEVGFFDVPTPEFADWLLAGLGRHRYMINRASWTTRDDAAADLSPRGPLSRRALVPVGAWTLLITDGPNGTDLGVIPIHAAAELGRRAVRAVCAPGGPASWPACILALYGPEGPPPLHAIRSIAAMNDGGRWVFEASGEPLSFEQTERYSARRKRDRFTAEMLFEYLRALRVPYDVEPAWPDAVVLHKP